MAPQDLPWWRPIAASTSYASVASSPRRLAMDFPKRMETLYLDMDQLLKSALPEALAIEELFFGHNVTTGIGVAQAERHPFSRISAGHSGL